MSMNRTETTSFQMNAIEIESLYEQLKKLREETKQMEKAISFLQGEVVGKSLNTTHPYYVTYLDVCKRINS